MFPSTEEIRQNAANYSRKLISETVTNPPPGTQELMECAYEAGFNHCLQSMNQAQEAKIENLNAEIEHLQSRLEPFTAFAKGLNGSI